MIVLKKLGGIRLPALVSLFAAVVMLLCLLLPYAVSTGAWDEMLEQNTDTVVSTEWGMTGKDMQSMSATTLTLKLNDYYRSVQEELSGVIMLSLLIACAFFCLLTILFSLMDKAIPTMVFALLSAGPFSLLSVIMHQDWSIGVDAGTYAWGVGYYLFFAAVVVTVGGAVWLLVEKIKDKKATQ